MYEVFDDTTQDPDASRAFAALGPSPHRYVLVRLSPEDDSWDWLVKLQHDVTGAVRSFRYLADKVRDIYAKEPRGDKVMASIDKHLAAVESLQRGLLSRLFGDHADMTMRTPKP